MVVLGLASCFGCQLQITMPNRTCSKFWAKSMCSIGKWPQVRPEPEGDVDVVIIEGAVSTVESREIVERWRKRAKCLIAMGACGMRRNSFHCGASFG